VSWHEHDETHWHIDLRCGECGHRWEAVVDDARAKRYDLELGCDTASISRTLERLDRERMAIDAETLADAFARDLIGPADFAA
jgi:hypothetical protein